MQTPKKINELASYLESKKSISDKELLYTIRTLGLKINDIGAYICFNHKINESYGRRVIYESSKVEIVAMSWNKGDFTSIHDHGSAQWGAVCSFGNIQNTCFKIENGTLNITKQGTLKEGEITIVDHSAIHQMGNPFNKAAISLHVYFTDKNVESVTGKARNFDLYSQTVYRANGGAFLDIPEKNIVSVEECPSFNNKLYDNYIDILQQYMSKRSFKSVSGNLKNFAHA